MNSNFEKRAGQKSVPHEGAPPAAVTVKWVCDLWGWALGREKFGQHENFFRAGGNSLIAARIASKARQETGLCVPVSALYKHPSPAAFARAVRHFPAVIGHARKASGTFSPAPLLPAPSRAALRSVVGLGSQNFSGGIYAASHAQKRLWVLESMLGGQAAYNVPAALLLNGRLDGKFLEKALNKTIAQHDAFRTVLREAGSEISQLVVRFKRVILVATPSSLEKALAEIKENAAVPFDLTRYPLFRFKLFRVAKNRHVFYFNFHHAVIDGVSTAVFMETLAGWYGHFHDGAPAPAKPAFQYADFTARQEKLLGADKLQAQEAYWKSVLSGDLPRTEFMPDFVDLPKFDARGERLTVNLPPALRGRLADFCTAHNTTLFVFFHACLKIVVGRYTGARDIVINVIASGRTDPAFDRTAGCFVNTLPMRDHLMPACSFLSFLKTVARTSGEALDNQDLPLDLILAGLNLPQCEGQTPISEVALAFQNYADPFRPGLFRGLEVENLDFGTATSMFNTLFIVEAAAHGSLSFSCEYKTTRYRRVNIQSILNDCVAVMRMVLKDPQVKLRDIETGAVRTPSARPEKKRVATECPGKVFEQVAAAHPEAVAVEAGDRSISYKELNAESNRLARFLLDRGVAVGNVVILSAERGLPFFIDILGILKAGGVYLPVEPSCPPERLRQMLKGSGAAAVLLDHDRFGRDLQLALSIRLDQVDCRAYPADNLGCPVSAEGLMYVIYTSGSTGEPKGVMISHASAMSMFASLSREYPLPRAGAYLFKTSASFDVSIPEIFMGLMSGRRVVVLGSGHEVEPELIYAAINKQCVSHVNFVPSAFSAFVDYLASLPGPEMPHLRHIFLAGEALYPSLVQRWLKLGLGGIKLHNLYGPTEFTVYATRYPLADWDGRRRMLIGKPFNGTEALVMDGAGHVLPPGIPGELCLSGKGLALGYLGRRDLTRKKFVPCPALPGRKMYRTGDIVRRTDEGGLEFLGRTDTQVKIRGYRIELDEITNVLLSHPEVENAACVVQENKLRNKYICAYYESSAPIAAETIAAFVGKKLPSYMVPGFFFWIKKLPLTDSGKIDRNRLRPLHSTEECGVQPLPEVASPLEQRLLDVWRGLLGKKEIGLGDSFFQIGGHSLKLVQLSIEIQKVFGVSIPLGKLYEAHTVMLQKRLIEAKLGGGDSGSGFQGLCGALVDKFKNNFEYKKTTRGGEELEIIYTDHPDIPEVISFLRAQHGAALPHYVLPLASRGPAAAAPGGRCPGGEIMAGLDRLLLGNKALNDAVRRAPVISEFTAPRIIATYIADKLQSVLLAEIDIEGKPPAFVQAVLVEMFRVFGVLRSTIAAKDGATVFREHEPLSAAPAFTLDLSRHAADEVNVLTGQIREKLRGLVNDRSYYDNLLFACAFLQIDLRRTKVIFALSHLIADQEAVRILKQFFENYGTPQFEEMRKFAAPYSDYARGITGQGTKNISATKKTAFYSELKRAVTDFYDRFPRKESIQFSAGYAIELEIGRGGKHPIGQALSVIVPVLSELFAIKTVPLRILLNNRSSADMKYYNTLGDLHDFIPMLLGQGLGGALEAHSVFEAAYARKLAKRINYLELVLGDRELAEMFDTPISVNFASGVPYSRVRELLSRTRKIQGVPYPVMSYSFDSKLLIFFPGGFTAEAAAGIPGVLEKRGIGGFSMYVVPGAGAVAVPPGG